jgi:LemA protein
MSTILLVLAAAAISVILWAVGTYNSLIKLRNRVKNAWGQIYVQLQRRHDLVPNLVESVKGYMKHERETLDAVVQARAQAVAARESLEQHGGPTEDSLKGVAVAEGQLGGALGRLMIQVEDYPDLKANENVLQLQEELSSTENKVAFARQAYNDQVLGYNNAQEQFPANMVAPTFGHEPADLFVVEDEATKKPPKVQL